ncbi:MAG: hypothetical protein NTW10_13975 [Bacteroidetes bacterium]|nr:hypothetical protein [Bacteroidota bacterium]
MQIPQPTRFAKMLSGRILRILIPVIVLLGFSLPSTSQNIPKTYEDTVSFDTVLVKKGTWFNYQGKVYKVKKDTVFVIESFEIPTIQVKGEQRSKVFYDSVYQKFSRKKFGKMIYGLAFIPPSSQPLPGTSDKVKSEVPFEQYKGKVIRHIHVCTLDPFGTSLMDTSAEARTGVGKALNTAHLKTKPFVIRKNLFIHEGQRVDPFILADNERNLREMSFLDNVRTVVTVSDSCADSVDITIITKDVWSIGFDVPLANRNRVNFRIYDGNFLGLADRLSTSFSMRTKRAPFFRLDGASYSYNNIAGTFLNSQITYLLDDTGNETFLIALNRNFYSIKTKWAYGVGYQYGKMVQQKETSNDVLVNVNTSYYSDENLWGGRAFLIKNTAIPTRFVITESFYNRGYTSRPPISVDSNRAYYNTTRFLTGFAIAGNNYYLSDYVFYFGKTENIPYGKAIKLTLGPEINDLYTRFYSSLDISAGDFLNRFGYLAGGMVLGGYLYHHSTEDCVLKMNLTYYTPLFMTPDKKFKFRTYYSSDYRYGFNFRKNNTDYTNVNNDLLIDHVDYDTVFYGQKSLSASLSVVMFSPLYFYGFRFAFVLGFKGGFVAPARESLIHQRFTAGVGLGTGDRHPQRQPYLSGFPDLLLLLSFGTQWSAAVAMEIRPKYRIHSS